MSASHYVTLYTVQILQASVMNCYVTHPQDQIQPTQLSFLLFLLTFGSIQIFGIFFSYYSTIFIVYLDIYGGEPINQLIN